MPCRCEDFDTPSRNSDIEKSAKIKNELDRVTRLLCFLTGSCLNEDVVFLNKCFAEAPDLKAWWDHHSDSDEKRLVSEMKAYLSQKPNATKKEVVSFFIAKAQKIHAVSDFHKELFFPECYEKALAKIQINVNDVKNKLTDVEYDVLVKHILNKDK